MAKPKLTVDTVIKEINEHKFEDLDAYLKDDVEWETIGRDIISPKNARKFIKSIRDKEVRIAVAKFMHKYARQYFREPAEGLEYDEKAEGMYAISVPDIHIKTADDHITLFQQELAFLLDQEESTGEFTGDKFKKLLIDNEELRKKIHEQEQEIAELSAIIDKFKHPSRHGNYIPKELQNSKFDAIIKHLQKVEVLRIATEPGEYGFRVVTCVHWDASKALFGYFVEKVNDALNLRGARVPLNWKVFKPAVQNYEDIVDEARKALSTYKNSSSLHPERITDSEKVDKAIELALAKKDKSE